MFCVCDRPFSELGCQRFIQKGRVLADVLPELALTAFRVHPPPLEPEHYYLSSCPTILVPVDGSIIKMRSDPADSIAMLTGLSTLALIHWHQFRGAH